MPAPNAYEVKVQEVTPRTIASVRARVRMGTVPAVFRQYLDRVYAACKAGAVSLDGQNVFVYRHVPGMPDQLDVDFGVGVRDHFADSDGVSCTTVPGGKVATTTHLGDYTGLRAAHDAIQSGFVSTRCALAARAGKSTDIGLRDPSCQAPTSSISLNETVRAGLYRALH